MARISYRLSGQAAYIEEVVVDKEQRGRQLGHRYPPTSKLIQVVPDRLAYAAILFMHASHLPNCRAERQPHTYMQKQSCACSYV